MHWLAPAAPIRSHEGGSERLQAVANTAGAVMRDLIQGMSDAELFAAIPRVAAAAAQLQTAEQARAPLASQPQAAHVATAAAEPQPPHVAAEPQPQAAARVVIHHIVDEDPWAH